jgi:ferritin-like metal-binding protein YciE
LKTAVWPQLTNNPNDKSIMSTLKDLFLNELADMYDAENRITVALPKLIKAATCHELQDVLKHHLQETEGQKAKIEQTFTAFNEKPRSKKCPAIIGILDECDEILSENKGSSSINAAVIAAAQKVEHYEIASYGTLHAWAAELDNPPASNLISEILDQEKQADQTLTDLSAEKNTEALEEATAR